MSSGEKAGKPIQSRNYRSRAGVFGFTMGETWEISVEYLPDSSLQIFQLSGGYDFLFVSFFS